MIRSGLVSVTFRALSPAEIIRLVSTAGLEGIEWGGDVHVPHGDLKRAHEVRRMTTDAGVRVLSYGSYYRVGHGEPVEFGAVIETATALGAPIIRVWPGKRGSDQADQAYRASVVGDARRIADLAAEAGLMIACEFHANTLTDTNESAILFLQEVASDNFRSYWQPKTDATVQYRLAGLTGLLPWLSHLHVFQRDQEGNRLPLSETEDEWLQYFGVAVSTGREHCAMLEFVKDDAPAQFLRDARTLKRWLAALV